MNRDAILERIRESVVAGTYVMTAHAVLEMREDRLDVVDVESCLLTGRIERILTKDPRGTRYEVIGFACDLATPVAAIVRFEGPLLIITVYEIKP